MDDVAAEFGISKKTVYQYFKGKEDLVNQVMEHVVKTCAFNLNDKELGNVIDRHFALRDHLLNVMKYINNNIEYDLKKLYPRLYKRFHDDKRNRIYTSTLENITEGIQEGWYRPGLDAEIVAKLQLGKMFYVFNPEYEIFSEQDMMNIEVFDKVTELFMYSVCTEKGLKYYTEQLNKIKNDIKN